MAIVWINNAFVEEEDALLPVSDAGLLHAAGVFTTMRAWGGRVFRLADHLRRLRESCEALFVPLQYRDEELRAAVEEVLKRNGLAEARLRLTVTRGTVKQDPLHGTHMSPNVFLTAAHVEPYPQEYYENGMTAVVLDDLKANPYDNQAGHKTLDYFTRLAALKGAVQRGAGEALWFNVHNYLQSGSVANVFLVRDGALMTPPTNEDLRDPAIRQITPYPRANVLPGITRLAVMELAEREGVRVARQPLTINDLLDADEVFVTNSVMGVMPVCRIERKSIGDDKPGPLTRKLGQLLAERMSALT